MNTSDYILLDKNKISSMMINLLDIATSNEKQELTLLDETITKRGITDNKVKITMKELEKLKQMYENII